MRFTSSFKYFFNLCHSHFLECIKFDKKKISLLFYLKETGTFEHLLDIDN